jgi:hypothetical protein
LQAFTDESAWLKHFFGKRQIKRWERLMPPINPTLTMRRAVFA